MGRKSSNVRVTDGKARVTLPAGFADCTVIIECPDANTVVVRKAVVTPIPPATAVVLSDADAEAFEKGLTDPPRPNAALKKLMREKRAK